MNIILIGMRGSGKSTVGRELAGKLGRPLIETDLEIEILAGCKISELVTKTGWDNFRDLESEIILGVALKDNAVISTGGGAVLRPQNAAALKKNGKVIWLDAPVKVLAQRIKDDAARPKLTGLPSLTDEIEAVYKERKSVYEKAADLKVITSGFSPENNAENIIEFLKTTKVL